MKAIRPTVHTFVAIALVGAACAYAFSGAQGLAGWSLGAGSGAFNMAAMWAAIGLMGKAYGRGWKPSPGDPFVGVAFLLKLPIYVAAGVVSHRVGGASDAWFLAAIALVYFALIWWALTRR